MSQAQAKRMRRIVKRQAVSIAQQVTKGLLKPRPWWCWPALYRWLIAQLLNLNTPEA